MLPKLQQSSIANSLRRDNLASQIQCTLLTIQAKTNSKVFLANKTTNPTNHGKINMPLKIHIHPLETSPKSTSQKRKSKRLFTNLFMNSHSQDPSQNIPKKMESEDVIQALSKKKHLFRNQYPNLALSRRDKSPLLNSEDTMTEEIYLSEWTIKILYLSSYGKLQSSPWTTITIYQFSLME
jgi:hypothetical protein